MEEIVGIDKKLDRLVKLIAWSEDVSITLINKKIKGLTAEGYIFVKAADLIYWDNYTIDNTGMQVKKQ